MAKGNGMEPPSTNGIILIGQTRTNFNTRMKAEEPEPSMLRKLPPLPGYAGWPRLNSARVIENLG